jgi:hypothetical protein
MSPAVSSDPGRYRNHHIVAPVAAAIGATAPEVSVTFRYESTLAGYARAAVDLRIRMTEYIGTPAALGYLTNYLGVLGAHTITAADSDAFADVITGMQELNQAVWSDADTYLVTPAMTAILAAAAQALDLTGDVLTPDAAPTANGILFLPDPIYHRAQDGQLLNITAVTWWTVDLDGTAMWIICGWYDPRDPDVAFLDDVTLTTGHGPLMLGDVRILPIGQPIGSYQPSPATEPEHTWETAPDGRAVITQADTSSHVVTALAYTFWRLQEQRLTTVARPPLDRAAARRAKKAHVNPDVRFIVLRRTSPVGDPGGQPKWHYRVRFVVRGHWRRTSTPDGGTRRRWVHAYIKGPDGAPLIHGEKVNILAR